MMLDPARALELYERLRRFEGPNDWSDSAHFRPAMVLYIRSNPGDVAAAALAEGEILAGHHAGGADQLLEAMLRNGGRRTRRKGLCGQ